MGRKMSAFLVLSFFLAKNSSAESGPAQVDSENQRMQITIGIYDYAHSKPGIVQEAERIAAAILSKAGVDAVWLECPTDEASPRTPACASLEPTHITLRLLPEPMSRHLRLSHGDALGFAALGVQLSCDAWVFYDRVDDFALKQQLTLERLLGAVIAHELGHLLLGENAHARTGLMHAYWPRSELLAIEFEWLAFSDAECERIRNGVIARRERAYTATGARSSLDSVSSRSRFN